jgi:hypothetical protein
MISSVNKSFMNHALIIIFRLLAVINKKYLFGIGRYFREYTLKLR